MEQQSNSVEAAERHETGKIDRKYTEGSKTECLESRLLKALGLSEEEIEKQ